MTCNLDSDHVARVQGKLPRFTFSVSVLAPSLPCPQQGLSKQLEAGCLYSVAAFLLGQRVFSCISVSCPSCLVDGIHWHFVHSFCLTSILSSPLHLVPGVSGCRHAVTYTRVGNRTCILFLLRSPECPSPCVSCDYSHTCHSAGRIQCQFQRRILPPCYILHKDNVFGLFLFTDVSAV